MITAITIWTIGYLVVLGMVMEEESDAERKSSWIEWVGIGVLLLGGWPSILGSMLSEIRKELRNPL